MYKLRRSLCTKVIPHLWPPLSTSVSPPHIISFIYFSRRSLFSISSPSFCLTNDYKLSYLSLPFSTSTPSPGTEISNVLRKRKFVPIATSIIQFDAKRLPAKARVVICGGGVVGASVAYHLALLGWGMDTLLLEQHTVGGDGPLCASGFVSSYEPTRSELKLAEYSLKLIKKLTSDGLPTGWNQVGSLNLGRTFDRMTSYKRQKSIGAAWGIPCEVLTPEECREKCELIEIGDIRGGLWIPDDGVCDPNLVCHTFIEEAKLMGVKVVEHCAVKKIRSEFGKVSRVDTSAGNITCDYFVNCTGFWAREVGTLSNPVVKIPLKSVEHHYLYTKPIPHLDSMTPFVRDYDGGVYFREKNGCIMAGIYH